MRKNLTESSLKNRTLPDLLYSEESFSQKLKRLSRKVAGLLILGASCFAIGYPVYNHFNRKNIGSFLEDVIEQDIPPLDKVCRIEEEFKNFSVLEYLSFFDYGRFMKLHKEVFDDFYSKPSVKEALEKRKPEIVLKEYYNSMEEAGFSYFEEPWLGNGFMQKKLNCTMRTLMFLSDLNYKLKMPLFGAVGENHVVVKYDDGQKQFFFDTVNGRIEKGSRFSSYNVINADKFLYAVLRNYVVIILRGVWKEGSEGYRLSNYVNIENACLSALEISSVAKKLNRKDGVLYLADAWAYLCLHNTESAENSFRLAELYGVDSFDAMKFVSAWRNMKSGDHNMPNKSRNKK